MKPMQSLFPILLLALGQAALAAGAAAPVADPSDLPPSEQALAAIVKSPMVRAAEAMLSAGREEKNRLEAGPHEWTVRMESQRRRVRATPPDATPDQRYNEWIVGLERPLRMPGKAGADSALGEQGVQQAIIAVDDARHESGRLLLRQWFTWLREQETLTQWTAQAELLGKQRAAVSRRLALGDASRLELAQAEAAAAQAEAEQARALARRDTARIELNKRFPSLALPAQVTLSTPRPVDGTLDSWRQQLFAQQHELRLARADSQRMRLLAARVDAERVPDPTVGVRLSNEFGGSEKIVGLSLAIPLAGGNRAAAARAQSAYAAAAAEREAEVLAKVEAEIDSQYASAKAAWASWQRAAEATQRMDQAGELVVRAHALGEAGLAEVLFARRQAHDARLAARLAQLDALETHYRLELDAHHLWADDDEDAQDGDKQPGR